MPRRVCPECGQVNWARRNNCRGCEAPNPNPSRPERSFRGRDRNNDSYGDNRSHRGDGGDRGDRGYRGDRDYAPRERRGYDSRGDRDYAPRERRDRDRDYVPADGQSQREYVAREGDWTCNECGNVNYAFRTECRRCHAPKA